jgi:hypothetical protein
VQTEAAGIRGPGVHALEKSNGDHKPSFNSWVSAAGKLKKSPIH